MKGPRLGKSLGKKKKKKVQSENRTANTQGEGSNIAEGEKRRKVVDGSQAENKKIPFDPRENPNFGSVERPICTYRRRRSSTRSSAA